LLHVLVVALTVGASFATVSLASEAESGASPVDDVAAASLQPLRRSEPSSTFAALAPVYVPPPQAQVARGALVVREHTLPPPPCIDDPAHPIFCVYTVQPGDTLSGIVERYGLSGNEYLSAVEMLAQSNKPDVVSSDEIVPGQKLRLPKSTGIIHTVLSTRTLSEVVATYGVTLDAVIAIPENNVSADGHIEVGQDLLIPDPLQLPPTIVPELPPLPEPSEEPGQEEPPAPVEPPPVDTPEPQPTETPEPEETPEPVDEDEAEEEDEANEDEDAPIIVAELLGDRPTQPSAYGFVWPVWGPISSYFGPGHPLGIDIDMYEDPNEPIGAAKAGIVTFAGGNPCCSYGFYVIIEHGDGTSTLYAHLSQIAVVQGQQVTTGQLIGFAGATGYATGNHLHFEVYIGDQVVDPLIFLPAPP
jgi:murein DD-endopeptidase MepM/ murein hydrolase activator NlpD